MNRPTWPKALKWPGPSDDGGWRTGGQVTQNVSLDWKKWMSCMLNDVESQCLEDYCFEEMS